MKRVFDFTLSAMAFVLLSPLLVLVAAAVKFQDSGPIFYQGLRVGIGGKPFWVIKFRTMIPNTEWYGITSTSSDDPRVTRLGSFLRRHKLDELPQLWNVLRGEMSLVGPRPEVQRFVDLYTEEEKVILSVRPGLTDWATLWNIDEGAVLQGSSDPDRDYFERIRPNKIRLQLAYVHQAGFWTDIHVLIHTIAMLAFRARRCEVRSLEIHQ
jgi:lipopolysaccharide/colanic/teichoic acid biosynthesis glycosyltransferase